MNKIQLDVPYIIDDFLQPSTLALIQRLVRSLKRQRQPGHVRTKYDSHILYAPTKKNKVVILNEGLEPDILKEIEQKAFNQLKLSSKASKITLGHPQFSFYGKDDYYGPHRDVTELGVTILLFPFEKKFRGGDLFFHTDKKLKVSYKTNRAIIFPSRLLHEVKPVTGGGIRVSLQFFLRTKATNKKPATHQDIRKNRKELGKKILLLSRKSTFEPEQLIDMKQELLNFRDHTLEGSYRYICQHCLGKQPVRVIGKISVKPHFSLSMSSRLMQISIQTLDKKLFTVITINKQVYRFPFELLTWEITNQLKIALGNGV